MQRTCTRLAAIALLLSALGSTTLAGDAQSGAGAVDCSVLTPGVSARLWVASGVDPFGISSYYDIGRKNTLRDLAQSDGYDAGTRLQAQLIDALQASGRTARDEPVERAAAGKPQSLSRGQLPEQPRGKVMLDTEIIELGLHWDDRLRLFVPYASIAWRLIGAHGDLLVPSHVLYFDGTTSVRNPKQKIPMAERGNVAPLADEHCGWQHYKDSVADPAALWQCYDKGFRLVGDTIVTSLPP